MVTVSNYQKRISTEGKEFFALVISGGVEFVKSEQSGAYYATARKALLATTFSEDTCKLLVGKQLPGIIERIDVEPYEITNPDTGEVKTVTHKYRFNPNANTSMEETVFTPEIAVTQG